MSHILAIRFSALGDVALTVPVLYSFATAYPNDEITLLSRPIAGSLLKYAPANVHFWGVNLNLYKGLRGLHRLAKEIEAKKFDAIADLHSVMRTWIIGCMSGAKGIPLARIDKGRKEKRQLTRQKGKIRRSLLTSTERYVKVFEKLGYSFPISFDDIYKGARPICKEKPEGQTWIGIAPFAAHPGKVYPLKKMERVIDILSEVSGTRIFLFGAGKKEGEVCRDWADRKRSNVVSMVGIMSMEEELVLMSKLDVMLTMDSANMHLASLVGCKTVSIWGATHVMAGFAGLQKEGSRRVEMKNLSCRPCSIFGNKECYLKQSPFKCMNDLSPELVVKTIREVCMNH